jgi:hypothetical protein
MLPPPARKVVPAASTKCAYYAARGISAHHADSRIMPTGFGTRQIAVEIAHFETTRSA